MKRNGKKIVISIVVLLALIVVLFAVAFIELPEEEVEETSTSEVETFQIFDRLVEDLESLEVTNPSCEMFITVSLDEEAITTSYIYQIEGYENYTLTTSISLATNTLLTLTSSRKIGEVDNLSAFGLDDESGTTVVLNFSDGTSDEIVIGDYGAETTGYYILVDDCVYIASTGTTFSTTPVDNVSTYSYIEAELDSSTYEYSEVVVDYMKFSGTNFPEEAYFYYNTDDYAYYMEYPYEGTQANFSFTESMAATLGTFYTNSVVALNVTEEELADYDLDEPMTIINFSVNDNEYEIAVSEKVVDGERYCYINGEIDIIYTVSEDYIASWAETTMINVRNTYVFMPAIMNVEEMEMEIDGESAVVNLSRTLQEDSTTAYDYTTELNNEFIEYSNVTSFYYYVIAIPIYKLEEEIEYDEDATSDISIIFNYYEGGSDTLEYFDAGNGSTFYAFVNGEYYGTVRDSNVEELEAQFTVLKESQTE